MASQLRIKDLTPISNPNDLLDKVFEVENAPGSTSDKSNSVSVPQFIQAVANNQPGANYLKSIIKSVKCYDTTDPQYYPGNSTLVELDPATLCGGTICYVVFPKPATYRLNTDAQGTVGPVSIDGEFNGNKSMASWHEVGSLGELYSTIKDFNPFATSYLKDESVKYNVGSRLRVFTAKAALAKSAFPNNRIPEPTGYITDQYWNELNPFADTPNTSRLGALACRFYTNAERATDPYPIGDTVEDLVARENAGADILFANREVTVELGANAGRYHVVYEPTNPDFYAYVDGSFTAGKNPCKFALIPAAATSIALTGITESVGGFFPGASFNGSVQAFAERLLIRYQHPGFTGFQFNGQGSMNVLAGTTYNAGNYRFDWGTSNSGNVAVNSVVLVDGSTGASLATATPNDGNETVAVAGFTLDKGDVKNFRILAQDTQGNQLSADLYLTGVLARFFGASSLTPAQLTAALTAPGGFIAGTYGLDEDLGTSLPNNITANCSGGKYVYYLFDAGFPDPTVVRAGLNAFSAYTLSPVPLTDQFGISRHYRMLYTGIQYGAAVNVNVVS